MAIRVYPINSPSDAAAETLPGVNDFDLTRIETNLFTEGVVQGVGDEFDVTEAEAGANMSVDIGTGLALIEIENTNVSHGRTTKTWFELTEAVNRPITTADATNPRKDRVVLRIDVTTDPNSTASNIGIIEVLAGTPAGSPSAPAEPANAITLAIVDIPASDTTVADSQITDSREYVKLNPNVLQDIAREQDVITKTRAVFNDFTEKTIASGVIIVDQVLHKIDTQSDAASDDLDTITAAVGAGEIVVIVAENTARTVVIRHNTGNIQLASGQDFPLDNTEKSITLIRRGSNWIEIARSIDTSGFISASENYVRPEYLGASDSATVGTSSSATAQFGTHDWTIPANDLIAGVSYEVEGLIDLTWAAGDSLVELRLGSTTAVSVTFTPTASGRTYFHAVITGTTAAGASAVVRGMMTRAHGTGSSAKVGTGGINANFATNGTLLINVTHTFSASNGSNAAILVMFNVKRISTTPF